VAEKLAKAMERITYLEDELRSLASHERNLAQAEEEQKG
jgi:hypothetical protein